MAGTRMPRGVEREHPRRAGAASRRLGDSGPTVARVPLLVAYGAPQVGERELAASDDSLALKSERVAHPPRRVDAEGELSELRDHAT